MFTHPALLRELTQTAELLRRHGEGGWSRRVIQTADAIRRLGWTEAAARALRGLFEGDPAFDALNFGAEHERFVRGPGGTAGINEALNGHRRRLRELGGQPWGTAPEGPQKRSPDLE